MEASLCDGTRPGEGDRIKDIVRYVFMGATMKRIADVVAWFDSSKGVVVVEVVDHFQEPTTCGW